VVFAAELPPDLGEGCFGHLFCQIHGDLTRYDYRPCTVAFLKFRYRHVEKLSDCQLNSFDGDHSSGYLPNVLCGVSRFRLALAEHFESDIVVAMEVTLNRCHLCLATKNLTPCTGNSDGACRNASVWNSGCKLLFKRRSRKIYVCASGSHLEDKSRSLLGGTDVKEELERNLKASIDRACACSRISFCGYA
jgi:hypothetical protein